MEPDQFKVELVGGPLDGTVMEVLVPVYYLEFPVSPDCVLGIGEGATKEPVRLRRLLYKQYGYRLGVNANEQGIGFAKMRLYRFEGWSG